MDKENLALLDKIYYLIITLLTNLKRRSLKMADKYLTLVIENNPFKGKDFSNFDEYGEVGNFLILTESEEKLSAFLGKAKKNELFLEENEISEELAERLEKEWASIEEEEEKYNNEYLDYTLYVKGNSFRIENEVGAKTWGVVR
jgi:hypothetical protein